MASPRALFVDHPRRLAFGSPMDPPGHRLSWEDLWACLPARGAGRLIGPPEVVGVLYAVMRALGPPWRELAARPEAVRATAAELARLRAGGAVARAGAGAGALDPVLARLEAALAARGACDLAEYRRWQLWTLAREGPPSALRDVAMLRVSAAAPPGAAELDLLRLWAARGAQVVLALAWDAARPAAFAHTAGLIASVEAWDAPAAAAWEVVLDDLAGAGPAAMWRRGFGARPAAMGPDAPPEAAAAGVLVPAEAGGEVAAAADAVARLVAAGAAPPTVAVVAARPARRHAMVRALAARGLAVDVPATEPLAHAPLGRLFMLALEAAHPAPGRPLAASRALALFRALGRPLPGGRQPEAVVASLVAAGVGVDVEAWHPAALAGALGAEAGAHLWVAWRALVAELALPSAPAAWGPALRAHLGRLEAALVADGAPAWAAARHRAAAQEIAAAIDALVSGLGVAPDAWGLPEALAALGLHLAQRRAPASAAAPGGVALRSPAAAAWGRFRHLVLVDPADLPAWEAAGADHDPRDAAGAPWRPLPRGAGRRRAGLADAASTVAVVAATGAAAPRAVARAAGLPDGPWRPPTPPTEVACPADDPRLARARRPPRGMALGPAARARLRRHLTARSQPAGELSELGRCAFRWAAISFWGLGASPPSTPAGGAWGEGSLVHRSLFGLWRYLRAEGGLAAARRAPGPVAARAAARVAEEAARPGAEAGLFADGAAGVVARARAAVATALAADLAAADDLEPLHAAWPFQVRLPVAGAPTDLAAHGAVDRLDVGGGRLRVVDVVRRPPSPRDGPGARPTQLAIWAAAAAPLAEALGLSTLQAIWQPTQGRVGRGGPRALAGPVAAVAEEATSSLADLLGGAWAGGLAAEPRAADGCRGCHLGSLCRRASWAGPAAEGGDDGE